MSDANIKLVQNAYAAFGKGDIPAILDVMTQTLNLDSDACREGALHGLGHWAMYYPKRVAAIIDEFLKKNPDLRPELRNYALGARTGCVL